MPTRTNVCWGRLVPEYNGLSSWVVNGSLGRTGPQRKYGPSSGIQILMGLKGSPLLSSIRAMVGRTAYSRLLMLMGHRSADKKNTRPRLMGAYALAIQMCKTLKMCMPLDTSILVFFLIQSTTLQVDLFQKIIQIFGIYHIYIPNRVEQWGHSI